jgi:HEAT repeat protein
MSGSGKHLTSHSNRHRLVTVAFLLALCPVLWPSKVASAQDPAASLPDFSEPKIPAAQVEKVFPERLLTLWLQALERPENELKWQAATTIALAHRRGMRGLDRAIPVLVRALDQPEQHANVRLAAAQALIALEARSAAPKLLAHAQADGVDMRNLVEPVLARWKFAPAGGMWLARLDEASPSTGALVLAIQGVQSLQDKKALPKLRDLAFGATTDPVVRIEAARALGDLQTSGLDKEGGRLAIDKSKQRNVSQLAAALVLRRQESADARRILQRIAVEGDSAAAVVAIDALLGSEPSSVLPMVFQSKAPAVRLEGIEAFRRRLQASFLSPVADLLDDPHPEVRAEARKALIEAAQKPEFRATVRQLATSKLGGQRWRALEQASILLGTLDDKSVANRLVELLSFERPEVFMGAAWALRKLAVAETLPGQLHEVERRWKQPAITDPRQKEIIDKGLAQLCASLGQARYAPAAKSLGKFIPKQVLVTFGVQSRIAAIWALGLIFEKAPPEILTAALIGRLSDESMTMPEDMRVRRMSAISLGRMKAKSAVEDLEKYYPKVLSVDAFPNACGWALEQMGLAKLPATGVVKVVQKGWFLESGE